MKEIWLILSGMATMLHRLSTIQGQARIALLRADLAAFSCMTVFSFYLLLLKETCAGGSLGGRGTGGSSAVVAACCHLGRVPIRKAGLQQGLCT